MVRKIIYPYDFLSENSKKIPQLKNIRFISKIVFHATFKEIKLVIFKILIYLGRSMNNNLFVFKIK